VTNVSRALVLFVVIAATVGCDRVTKHLAATTLAARPMQSFLSDTVRLEYAENAGAFLGLGAAWPAPVRIGVLSVGNALLLVGLAVAAFRVRWPAPALVGFALFAAGGISNLADRMAHGSVIDFLNVGIGPLRTGIFNVADVAILVGAALVAFAGRSEHPRD
jgi:signal peptidase II